MKMILRRINQESDARSFSRFLHNSISIRGDYGSTRSWSKKRFNSYLWDGYFEIALISREKSQSWNTKR